MSLHLSVVYIYSHSPFCTVQSIQDTSAAHGRVLLSDIVLTEGEGRIKKSTLSVRVG